MFMIQLLTFWCKSTYNIVWNADTQCEDNVHNHHKLTINPIRLSFESINKLLGIKHTEQWNNWAHRCVTVTVCESLCSSWAQRSESVCSEFSNLRHCTVLSKVNLGSCLTRSFAEKNTLKSEDWCQKNYDVKGWVLQCCVLMWRYPLLIQQTM